MPYQVFDNVAHRLALQKPVSKARAEKNAQDLESDFSTLAKLGKVNPVYKNANSFTIRKTKMAKKRLSMKKANVERREAYAAGKKKASRKKKVSKKKVSKKSKKGSKKSRSRKGKIPLEVLEKRQHSLTRLVKRRGGTVV